MKVAILGYGLDGNDSSEHWFREGHDITICDKQTDLDYPEYAKVQLGEDYLKNLHNYDILVRTPGLHPQEIVKANPEHPDILKKVTSSINEFFEKCPAKIIGVTGTKGKGTTCMIIYKILKEAGVDVQIGGNIGIVPLEFLHKTSKDSWVVLELSNFQMIDFKYSPHVGVCLMLAPEHQDWHNDVAEYFSSKENLFAHQTDNDRLVYNANNVSSVKVASVGKASKIPYFVPDVDQEATTTDGAYIDNEEIYFKETKVCDVSDVALLGRHNLENICAAIATVWPIIDHRIEPIIKVIKEFTGMEHRLEFVREFEGVKYYNDSFATTPEATIAAIRSFKEPKIMILGGYEKNIPLFEVISEVVEKNVKKVIVIGDTGEKIIELLVREGYENIVLGGTTMQEIVNAAKKEAVAGDVVLLSTACASFGLFKDYKDRGNQFKKIVNSL